MLPAREMGKGALAPCKVMTSGFGDIVFSRICSRAGVASSSCWEGGGLIPNQDEQNAQAGEPYPSQRRETSHSGVGLGIRFWSTIQR
jgi:hypothetical protein